MTEERSFMSIVATAGVRCDGIHRGLAPPLWCSDTYGWADPDTKPVYDYARSANPNRDLLAQALADLEGGCGGVITGAGQSATLLALMLVPAGRAVVAPHDCYGGTYRLIKGLADVGKIDAIFVDQTDDAAYEAALERNPALVWIETPSNPLLRLVDIADRASRAKSAGALVAADNTLATPCRQQPLALGCDIVMHSTSKALNGHADLIGGALVTAGPDLLEQLLWWANAAGLTGPAHDAWLTLRGLRTLPLRVDRQEASARRIAEWLMANPMVEEVYYPGLRIHPDFALAERQQSGPGLVLSFRLKGGVAASGRFLPNLKIPTLAASLGSFGSLICRPATMTHAGMPPEARAAAGITDDLIRLSVGLEEPEDLIADFEQSIGRLERA
jgi:cystathionine gamma-synthase